MKKLGFVLGLSSLVAMPIAAEAMMQGNFLLGVEGGYASRSGDVITNIPVQPFTHTKSQSDNGGVWGVLGGYQVQCHNFLLGLEGKVSWQDFGDTQNYQYTDAAGNAHGASAKYKRDTVFGLTARAGYQLAPWMMPYLRAGAETSDDKMIYTANDTTTPKTVNLNHGRRNVRFVGGVGLEFPLIEDATLRVEYDYSSNSRALANGFASNNVTYYTARDKAHQHAGLVQLVWNFR